MTTPETPVFNLEHTLGTSSNTRASFNTPNGSSTQISNISSTRLVIRAQKLSSNSIPAKGVPIASKWSAHMKRILLPLSVITFPSARKALIWDKQRWPFKTFQNISSWQHKLGDSVRFNFLSKTAQQRSIRRTTFAVLNNEYPFIWKAGFGDDWDHLYQLIKQYAMNPFNILTNKITFTINAAVKIITRFRQFNTRDIVNLHFLGIRPVYKMESLTKILSPVFWLVLWLTPVPLWSTGMLLVGLLGSGLLSETVDGTDITFGWRKFTVLTVLLAQLDTLEEAFKKMTELHLSFPKVTF